jgi:NADPH2:quinone reductase
MDAWVVRENGNPWEVFRREDFPEPTPERMRDYALGLDGLHPRAAGEPACEHYVLMRVSAAALAWPDVTMATGEYPVPVPRPYVSGQEAVGIVEYASPALAHLEGKRVVAFTPQPWGSLAPLCVATAPTVFEAPPELSDEEAAAFLIASHTAYQAVHRRGQIQPGETVLVLGAAGGVPSAAVQLCLAAGARVVAVAGGAKKVDFCRRLGAQIVIDHRAEDFVAAVTREVGASSIDMIVDFVQGEPGQRARPLLRVEGRHVMAGHAGGLLPVHPNEFYLQNWTLIGCCMGSGYGEELPEIEQHAHDHLLRLVAEGRYRPSVGRVVDFDAVPEALRDFRERRVLGRTVVRIPPTPEPH